MLAERDRADWPRLVTALACLALAVLAVGSWLRSRELRRAILLEVEELSPVPLAPDVVQRIRREDDPARAQIRAVRVLVAQQLDPSWLAELSVEERRVAMRESVAVLGRARQLALEVQAARPGSWEAPLLVGAAAFLEILRDDRIHMATRSEEWEAPLLSAYGFAAGRSEAARYLAFAYVETWLSMSQAQKVEALPVLQVAFGNPATFSQLIDPWLRVVHERDLALSAIPDGSNQWRMMMERFTAQKDWRNLAFARRRYRESSLVERTASFEHATRRWQGGEYRDGRVEFAGVLAGLQPGGEWLPLLQMTLDSQPEASSSSSFGATLKGWLLWSLDLCYVGHCPIEGPAMRRLIGFSDSLEPPREAWAWISAGELGIAEQVEKNGRGAFKDGWSPYLIMKAAGMMDRGELVGARDALVRVDDALKGEVPYLVNRLRLAELEDDTRLAGNVQEQLAMLAARSGSADRWRRLESGAWQTDLLSARTSTGIRIQSVGTLASGAVVDVRVNGEPPTSVIVGASATLEVDLEAGAHRLTVDSVVGGFVPGRVELF